jgi:hypothetical protein
MSVYICNMCVLATETPVDKKPKTELEQLREDNRKLCARIDEREAALAGELERNMQLHAENKQQRVEITRLDTTVAEMRDKGALLVRAIDVAGQLIGALIAWTPPGQVLSPEVSGLKLQLDEVLHKIFGDRHDR